MKRNIYKTFTLTAQLFLAAMLLFAGVAQAQLITNGDMEAWTGNCPFNTPPNSWDNYSTSLGPDQAGTCAGTVTSHGGNSHMNLVWINSGVLEGTTQVITGLTLGHVYRISFWGINNQGLYAAQGDCKIQVIQNSLSIFETPNLVSGGAWTNYTVDFTATSLFETVGVRVAEGTNTAPGSGAAGVDDFSVTELVGVRDAMMHKPSTYPNPAHDALYITQGDYVQGELANVPFSISNLMGQQVMASTVNFVAESALIDVSKLQPGVYTLDVTIGSDRLVRKIVVE